MLRAILLASLFSAYSPSASNAPAPEAISIVDLDGNHDLSLPDWGPYTKNYIGLSHISDKSRGLRFDVSVFPGLYRRKVALPNVNFESGFHPWEASSDLQYFSFRHDLEWKDRVYADISYSAVDDHSRLIRAELVNNTELAQSLVLHLLASLHFPSIAPYSPDEALQIAEVTLPEGGIWLDALDYNELDFHTPRASDGLVYDGWKRGEIRAHNFVGGRGIGGLATEGKDRDEQPTLVQGDSIRYQFHLQQAIDDAHLSIRYRSADSSQLYISVNAGQPVTLTLPRQHTLTTHTLPLGQLAKGEHSLKVISRPSGAADVTTAEAALSATPSSKTTPKPTPATELSQGAESDLSGLEIDGFAIVPGIGIAKLEFNTHQWQPRPAIISSSAQHVVLKYPDTETYYGIRWFTTNVELREILQQKLDGYFEHITNHHSKKRFVGDKQGHYTNVFMRPIHVAPHSQHTVYAFVLEGDLATVERTLKQLPAKPAQLEKIVARARQSLPKLIPVNAGETYRFSQTILAATLLTNVVFPVYTQEQYIRHSAPGRWWDSLYTWDSGFIGIGLITLDPQRSVENLNAYLTQQHSQSAFIHHGTPLPVQHYQFLELWNRTQSTELLRAFYPKLKRYYNFLAGNDPLSRTRPFATHLLNTWDYFYNSGGWDDYPAQSFVHANQLSQRATPVVATAHVVRAAKILTMAAQALGYEDDAANYARDVARFADALHRYSWDESAGYFSYVVHKANGEVDRQLRTAEGENFNRGLDGVSPLVAGVTTPAQNRRLIAHLKNPEALLSPIGLSAVDQSASYYRKDGYWNGTVWMPHQWFIWKSLLDLGEAEFAFSLASTALELWKQETEATYNSFEHFVIDSGRGAGWHQFGGLSAPVLDWYSSYYLPGSITGGLDLWISQKSVNKTNTQLLATLKFYSDDRNTYSQDLNTGAETPDNTIIVVMNEAYRYSATLDGKPLALNALHPGAYTLQVPDTGGKLEVVSASPHKHGPGGF